MSRPTMFILFYIASFLQACVYGLTFLLPRLFDNFGADEKVVGSMLFITAIITLLTVYYSGHLADRFGRVKTLAVACLAISLSLFLYAWADSVGIVLVLASILLGFGWGNTYALSPVVLTRLVGASDRVRYFAILSIAIMAGFGLSPVFASLLEDAGYSLKDAFYVCAALCFVSAILFYGIITAVQRYAINPAAEIPSRLSLQAVKSIVKSAALTPIIMVCLGASVFAGMNNFQTVFADERGLKYAGFFLVYTITVVIFRIVLAKFKGGNNPYLTIAILQYVMFASVILFIFSGNSEGLYLLVAFLFGIGYGVSYPILTAMTANDASAELLPQTLQLFALSYFIGIFGFPLIAGWLIVEVGTTPLLIFVSVLAVIEATMALIRSQVSEGQ